MRFCTTALSLILLALPACRLGNRVEKAPEPPPTFAGFYQTESAGDQALKFCFKDHQDVETCQFKNPAQDTPVDVASVMRNPVALQILDNSTGRSALFDPFGSGSSYLTVYLSNVYANSSSTNLNFNGSTQTVVAWEDPNCTYRLKLRETGEITKGNPTTILGVPTSGRVSLDIGVEQVFEIVDPASGTCAASLQAMHACYLDLASCGASPTVNLQYVQSVFGQFIEVGLISAADIPMVRSLSYSVKYQ